MSLLAVKEYAAGVCRSASDAISQNTEWSGGLTCYRQLPTEQRLGDQTAACLGTIEDSAEKRLSGPRGFGNKMVTYLIPIFLHAISDDEQNGADDFDILCNLIIEAFRNCDTGQTITDPKTGQRSQLFKVGEEISLKRYEPVLFKRGLTRMRFMAELELAIQEIVQG